MGWIDDAKSKLTYLKGLYSTRDGEFQQRDDMYTLDHDAAWGWDAPTERSDVRVISSRATRLVKHVKGLYLSHTPRIIASPLKPSKQRERIAGELERFLLGVLQTNEERFGSVFAKAVEMAGIRGWGSWFVAWDVDREDDEGDDLGCPIVWRAIDPEYLYYESGGVKERFASVMYAITRRRADVEREWNRKVDNSSGDAKGGPAPQHDATDDTVEYVDYWWWGRKGRKWCVYNAIWAGNTVLKRPSDMPNYTRLPYLTWFTQPAPFSEPEYWGTGWAWDLRESLKLWERAANREMRRLTFAADNQYVLEAKDNTADSIGEGWELTLEPGSIQSIPRGWAIKPLVTVGPSPEAERMLAMAEAEMDAVLPKVSQGTLPGGDTDMSGVTFHGVAEAAAMWLAPDTESLVQVLRSCCELILDLCQGYAGDKSVSVVSKIPGVRVPTIERTSLKGSEMAGYRIDVSIDTDTPADDMRLMQIGMQMLGAEQSSRPFSMRTIQERFFKVDDPDRENDERLVEYLENQPQMLEYLAALAADRYGLPKPPPATPAQMPSPPPGSGGVPSPGGMPPSPMGAMPGQQAMQPGGMMGMPQVPPQMAAAMMAQQGPVMPPNNLVSPQEMMGSPAPMPVGPQVPMPPRGMPR